MLNPDRRSLTTSLLTPPPGMILDRALATTYTLDLLTLLTAPVHLALLGAGSESELLTDPLCLQEALRRTTDRLTIFTDRGRIQPPDQANLLLSLLEPTIVEVQAPFGGAFHAKIWVLRFADPVEGSRRLLRLGVLTRNVTADRSWDLALQLEGEPSDRAVAANRELAEFVRDLPEFAVGPVADARRQAAAELGDDLGRTRWDLPGKWEEVSFHVLGRTRQAWRPPASSRLAVVSPFLGGEALKALARTTQSPVELISRPEALQELEPGVRATFGACWCLDEAAETEDGEESSSQDQQGLHAKAYVLERGWYSHLILGSANATDAALLHGTNVEVLAELRGRRSQVGDIDTLLGLDDLGRFLHRFEPSEGPVAPDMAILAAEQALEALRRAVSRLDLRVRCDAEGGDWRLSLSAPEPLPGIEIAHLKAWVLTVPAEQASDASGLLRGESVSLGLLATEQVTGLVGLEAWSGARSIRFVLNLPVDGQPTDRDGAILRKILHDRERFLRYLHLLLGDFSGSIAAPRHARRERSGAMRPEPHASLNPLLEDLVRALSRDPGRLREIRTVVHRLERDGAQDILPPDFQAVWQVLAATLEERSP